MQSSQWTQTPPKSLFALPREVMVSLLLKQNSARGKNFYISELKLTLINTVYKNQTCEGNCVTTQNLTVEVNLRVPKGLLDFRIKTSAF